MTSRTVADQVALRVWGCTRDVLNTSESKLEAFSYSCNSVERWLVCEVYARLWDQWQSLPGLKPHWDTWMEAILPGQPSARQHIDLFVGEWEPFPPKPVYFQPKLATPAFEFKIVRSDDLHDRLASVAEDVAKLDRAGLVHKYIVVMYRVDPDIPVNAIRESLRAAVPRLDPLGEAWGQTSIDLGLYGAGQIALAAEAFRVRG